MFPSPNRWACMPHIVKTRSKKPKTVRRWSWRYLGVLSLVLGFLALCQFPANAAPVDVNTVPSNLRQYIVGTPEWNASPWMTSRTCQDQGGDWSVYTEHVLNDTPALLQFFQPDFGGDDGDTAKARGQEILASYRDIAAQIRVPAGYCVNQVKQWAGSDPTYKPFGFDWGNAAAGSGHSTDYVCNNNVGADKAPCGGFYIGCGGAMTHQANRLCQAWNAFSDDYVKRVKDARSKAINDHPASGQASIRNKTPGEIMQDILDWTVQHGMKQVTSFVIDGVTKLWAIFLKIAVDYTTPNLTGVGFADVYNLVAGVALAMAFLGWLVTLASSWKQGRLQFALLGGVKAAVGVTLAGVGAIFMLQLADDCTKSLVQAGGDLAHQADFTTSLVKANPLVALIVGVLIAIFLIFATIFLVIHSALVLMWALMGSVAAAGQVHPASSSWLVRWASRLTALAWSKFVMVAVMLLAETLLLPLDAGEDPMKQVIDIVQGLALSFLLITTPFLLWELVDFVGDRVGGAAASGSRASLLAAAATGRIGAAGGSAVGNAVGTMMASAADLGRRFTGGSTNSHDGRPGSGLASAALPPQRAAAMPNAQRNSGEGGSARPPSGPPGTGESRPANPGQVYSGSPSVSDSFSSGGTTGSGGAGGSVDSGRPAPPPIPPA